MPRSGEQKSPESMNRSERNLPASKSIVLLLAATAAISTTVAGLLTDPLAASTLWPNDIHKTVLRLAGGEVHVSPSGVQQFELPWTSVFLRCAVIAVLGSGVTATVTWFRRPGVSNSAGGRATWSRSFWGTIRRLSFFWLWSLVWAAVTLAASLLPESLIDQLASVAPNLVAAMFAAGTICALWPETAAAEIPTAATALNPSFTPTQGLVWLAVAVWTGVSFWMNERLYAGLWIPHGDSAMYEEHLWNVWHGKGFRSYLDQGLFLGEHIQVIHLLLLPLHMLWPSHLLLELAESFSLAVCAVPIWRMARRYSGSEQAALWLAGAWLMYFPMHFLDIAIDLKTLRPSCYGLPFLLWGIDLAERHRLKSAGFCLLIAMSAQEDFALIIGPVGFVLWLIHRTSEPGPARAACAAEDNNTETRQRRKTACWSLCVCGFSIAYVLLAVLIVIPWFRSGMPVHYSRYFGDLGDSPGDLARTTLRDPLLVLSHLLTTRTLSYVLVLALPLGSLVFRSPLRLLAGAATFVMLSLIELGDGPVVPYHHFHAPLMPVVFWAAAAGIGAAGSRDSGRLFRAPADRARFAFFCSLCAAVTTSMMPVGAAFWSSDSRTGYSKLFVPGPRAEQFPKILEQLTPDSRVASTDYVHTRLTHFDRSYDYSDYVRAVNNYQTGVPDDTDYIVIDTRHPYSKVRSAEDVRELRESPQLWELLPDRTGGYFLLLKRR